MSLTEKLFASQTAKVRQQWAKNLTLEQIEEYERQGMDMTDARQIREEHLAAKQKLIQDDLDAIDLNKLNAYKNARSAEDAFVCDVAKLNGISDKKKQKLELAPLVYGKVVQAYWELFKSDSKNKRGGGIVFLFALDDAHRYNEEWLTKTAERISEMKVRPDKNQSGALFTIARLFGLEKNGIMASILESKRLKCVPEDCKDFIKRLRNDTSSFCFPVSASLNEEGADAWCATFTLDDQKKLPLSHIPYNRIIPLLISEQPKLKAFGSIYCMELIPPAYYTK